MNDDFYYNIQDYIKEWEDFKDLALTHKKLNQLQSNWNSLKEYIEENKKVAMKYTKEIELSGLCQRDYPIPYYYALKRIELDNLYLDKITELEG